MSRPIQVAYILDFPTFPEPGESEMRARGNRLTGVGGIGRGGVHYPPLRKLSKNPSRQSLVREKSIDFWIIFKFKYKIQ